MDVILVGFTLISFFTLGSTQFNATCQLQAKKSDDCLRHAILIGREELVLPRSVRQMDELICSTLSEDIRCLSDMRSCLKSFPRTMFNVVMRSVKNGIKKQFCGSPKDKRKIVLALKCVQGEEQIKRLYNIIDKLSASIDFVASRSAVDFLLPHACCTYFHYLGAGKVIMDDICAGNSKLADTTITILASFFDDVIDLGCGKFNSVSHCESAMPSAMRGIRGAWNNQTSRYATSPILPVLTILERLDSKITFSSSSR